MSGPELAQYAKDGDGRAYRHPYEPTLYVPSITTVNNLLDKGGGLAQFAADMTLLWANKNWALLGQRSDEDAFKAGRFRWKDATQERAEVGTNCHEWIEVDLLGRWDYPTLDTPDAVQVIEQYQKFRAAHRVEAQYVETTFWSYEHRYAGTADWVGTIDGTLSLVDNKTSRGLYLNNELQIAALECADIMWVKVDPEATRGRNGKYPDGSWVEVPVPKFEWRGFLHLRPDWSRPYSDKVDPAFWEMKDMRAEEIPILFEIFAAYRKAWDGHSRLKEMRKEEDQ